MNLAFDHPVVLLLLPLALLPFATTLLAVSGVPSLAVVPNDAFSWAIDWALRVTGAVAIGSVILGLAGLHSLEQIIERQGSGAHIVLLIDRSSSMDSTFANRLPSGEEESKSAEAKHLISEFVARRPHDRIGIAAFSTAPMTVLPLTDHQEAVQAAIAAIDRPGLAYTDVGRGLLLAMSMVGEEAVHASRAIVLVSDGAAVIDRKVQAALRESVVRNPINLYWLFLRTKGSNGIFEPLPQTEEDTPQTNPERHLHLFLSTLGIPYRAFEATSPQAVEQAIAAIDKQELQPLRYFERIPRRDRSDLAYVIAAAAVLLLILAKLAERGISDRRAQAQITGDIA
jgi:mxaC protein